MSQGQSYAAALDVEKKHRSALKIFGIIILRFFYILLLILLLALYGVYNLCQVIFLGPSQTARDKLVISALETSAMKFLPGIYLSSVQIEDIVENNSVADNDEVTNPGLVSINIPSFNDSGTSEIDPADDEWLDYPDGIRIDKIYGETYRGYVMLIRDPSRMFVGTSSDFNSGKSGINITQVIEREKASAGINGGGFPDDGGVGSGDVPIGFTMSKGKVMWGELSSFYSGLIGIDENNVLIVGSMTGQKAVDIGIRDCVCFGPVLVVNGVAASVSGVSSGVNPRTAIGQRADGTLLLVCIDGRMVNSLGATLADLIDIFVTYEAVNAANLDGGTSTAMIYNNELVNVPSSLYGPRRMPTFFLIK